MQDTVDQAHNALPRTLADMIEDAPGLVWPLPSRAAEHGRASSPAPARTGLHRATSRRLFQRTLPGFEPSPQSYAPAVRALARLRELLARNGITEPRHLDMATALVTGLVDQQVSNDPGGDRWIRLIDESIDVFLAHCQPGRAPRTPRTRTAPANGALQ